MTMHALSSMDAAWFLGETPSMSFHVANLHLFDKPPRGADPMRKLREQVGERAPYLPLLHRRLDQRSLKMGNPVWIDEPDLDLDYHLQRIKLPAPGRPQQLIDAVVQLHTPLLDRAHPLWQIWLIEGLAGGGFALYMKLHHGGVDGGSASMVVDGLFGDTARPQGTATGAPVQPTPPPTPASLLLRTAEDLYLRMPLRVMQTARELWQLQGEAAPSGKRFGLDDLRQLMRPAPRTPFNRGLSPARSFGWASLPLSAVKALGKAHQATINDIVLAVITGALRQHLAGRQQLPRQPLVAGVPVSVRTPGDTAHNNQVSLMLARLPVDEADPARWIPVIRRSVDAAKNLQDAARPVSRLLVEMPSLRAPAVNNLMSMMEGMKAAEDLRLHHHLPPFVNLYVSNVPGPRQPLRFDGMAARTFIPVPLLMHGTALNITCVSYLDRIDFGVLASPEALPDAQALADGLVEAYGQLQQRLAATAPAAAAGNDLRSPA
ncbi:MAG: wax ester/triacylglycerol synthase family O-acyltransferase [Proteobacteria bacterium]|nr:wax ester/triacylglycerol synthase family O-acyltransferase [Pseudomonadota bacterium]